MRERDIVSVLRIVSVEVVEKKQERRRERRKVLNKVRLKYFEKVASGDRRSPIAKSNKNERLARNNILRLGPGSEFAANDAIDVRNDDTVMKNVNLTHAIARHFRNTCKTLAVLLRNP